MVHVCCPPSCHSRKPPLEAILPHVSRDLGLGNGDDWWGRRAAGGAEMEPLSGLVEDGGGVAWVELFGRECRRGGLVVGNQAVALNRRHAWVADVT